MHFMHVSALLRGSTKIECRSYSLLKLGTYSFSRGM